MTNAVDLSRTYALAPLVGIVSKIIHVSTLDGIVDDVSLVASLANQVDAIRDLVAQGSTPTGTILEYSSNTLPNGYIWADGSVLPADTPHQVLRTLYINDNFPHGQDGNGNPKVPDRRGNVAAGADAMGGTAAGRMSAEVFGSDPVLGAQGGVESITLTAAQSGQRAHTHTASSTFSNGATSASGDHTHTIPAGYPQEGATGSIDTSAGAGGGAATPVTDPAGNHSHTVTGTVSTTVNGISDAPASEAHGNIQPTFISHFIIKT